jgi:hypothetical protein
MERERVDADPEEIEHFYEQLELVSEDLPAGLLINLDETGHQEWVDAHRELVMVPVEYSEKTILIPVDRSEKRSTLLGAIAVDGTCLKSMVVVPRITIETELYEHGEAPDKAIYVH